MNGTKMSEEEAREEFRNYCKTSPDISRVTKCSKCGKKRMCHEMCNGTYGHIYLICEDCFIKWCDFIGNERDYWEWTPEQFKAWLEGFGDKEIVKFT